MTTLKTLKIREAQTKTAFALQAAEKNYDKVKNEWYKSSEKDRNAGVSGYNRWQVVDKRFDKASDRLHKAQKAYEKANMAYRKLNA